jgi:Na+/H+ antiporter NhaD/arsenite permease-like protein
LALFNIAADINVLFPFHIPIYVPRVLWTGFLNAISALRIINPPQHPTRTRNQKVGAFVLFRFPMNFVTAPLVADLFLLAILAIGRKEVHDGTLGVNGIVPYDIMLFFLSLAYIAISVDASGLIRWLAFKVLQKGGKVGHRLFFYLYAFFFTLTTFIGNDPIILSGTAFLSYMTRVSSNIKHPRAWIYTQFAVANIASAILVSSNPTNLVLAGAFNITFLKYTANVIVPVIVTGIVLFPFLLYIIFHDESLIPASIKMEDLPEELKNKKPVNPNIPYAKGELDERERDNDISTDDEQEKQLSLEEILNPFLDKKGAIFGAAIMAATLVTVLGLNASSSGSGHERPVFWVTLPAAFVMFCFDLTMGWLGREETRRIAHEGRQRVETAQAERAGVRRKSLAQVEDDAIGLSDSNITGTPNEKSSGSGAATSSRQPDSKIEEPSPKPVEEGRSTKQTQRTTLASLVSETYQWAQETFPTTMTVFHHLPFALIPFAFCMFVLVQALVTKGWVPVFAYGWDHWVEKTGTVGAVGGMGFVSVILCNVRPCTLLPR